MKILVLGKKGMLAHVVIDHLSQKYDVDAESLRKFPVECLDLAKYDIVINCVGILVKESELRKDLATYYNTYLPHYLSSNTPGKVIHISTDCVFDDTFYGKTKKLGELDNSKDVTLRTSIIGPELNPKGSGLFNWFYLQKRPVNGYQKAMWNGVTTIQLAKCIDEVINQNLSGIQNIVTKDGISKYDILSIISRRFGKNLVINGVAKGEDKRLKPTTNIELPDYETQIREMENYIDARPEIYSHYMCQ